MRDPYQGSLIRASHPAASAPGPRRSDDGGLNRSETPSSLGQPSLVGAAAALDRERKTILLLSLDGERTTTILLLSLDRERTTTILLLSPDGESALAAPEGDSRGPGGRPYRGAWL